MKTRISICNIAEPKRLADDNDAVLYFGKAGEIDVDDIKQWMLDEGELNKVPDDKTIIIEGIGDAERFYNFCCIG